MHAMIVHPVIVRFFLARGGEFAESVLFRMWARQNDYKSARKGSVQILTEICSPDGWQNVQKLDLIGTFVRQYENW